MAYFCEHLRRLHYDEIHIAPHMDDAVYSSGGRIAQLKRAGKHVLVVTVFGTGKAEADSQGSGLFDNYALRCREEKAAMESLDLDYIWLNVPELMFRAGPLGEKLLLALPFLPTAPSEVQDRLYETLLGICDTHLAATGRVLFPIAMGFHPDHRMAFDVGRSIHALGTHTVEFYEDVSYSYSACLVALRLKYLGMPAKADMWSGAWDVNQAFFKHSKLMKWLALPLVTSYFACLFLAHTVIRKRDVLPGEGDPTRLTRHIEDTIHEKVAAMRKYETQTAYFFALDDSIYELLRQGGIYAEYSWVFPPTVSRRVAASAERTHSATGAGAERTSARQEA